MSAAWGWLSESIDRVSLHGWPLLATLCIFLFAGMMAGYVIVRNDADAVFAAARSALREEEPDAPSAGEPRVIDDGAGVQ